MGEGGGNQSHKSSDDKYTCSTNYMGRCRSNYHTITTNTTVPVC